jgi:aminopeptidase N
MWHELTRRGVDHPRPFALPTARPHYPPDRPVRLERVHLELRVEPDARRIQGRVTLELVPRQPITALTLDAAELTITGVSDGAGHPLPFEARDPVVEVQLPAPAAPHLPITVTVAYEGTPRRGLYFISGSPHAPQRPAEVWTQGQDDDSRHWFPCLDHPFHKARTELVASIPEGLFALSNGVLVADHREGGRRIMHYRHDTPHPAYLVTLVVGDYVAIEDHAGPLPVVSYVHPHQLAQGKLTFARTAEMVAHFSALTGIPYPYPRYSQIVVADFIFGGMENTTATSLTEHILFDERSAEDVRPRAEALIAHELAHQWWGDLVTCTDWAHGWLHEGFATYFEILWRAHADGAAAADHDRLTLFEAYLAEPYRRALVTREYEEPIELFDRHLYEKGATVLHYLHHLLGDAAFFAGLAHYAARFRSASADSHDLARALEEATGRNLERLFEELIHRPGHPKLDVKGRRREGGYELTVRQTAGVYQLQVDVDVVTDQGRSRHVVRLEEERHTLRLPAQGSLRYVVFDPGGHLPAEVTLGLPSGELRALVDEEPDVRAVIAALRALARGGEPASLEAVQSILQDDLRPEVRVEAAKALGRVPTDAAREALMDAVLQDGSVRVRRTAIRALARFTAHASPTSDFLIRHMEIERSDYALADTVRTLAELGAQTLEPSSAHDAAALAAGAEVVHRALDRQGHLHCIRAAAVEGLARLRALDALPRIAACAGPESHPRVREAAVSALGSLGGFAPPHSLARTEVRERLEGLLDDPGLRIRINAAHALLSLREPAAVGALEAAAARELDGRARRAMRLAAAGLADAAPDAGRLERLEHQLRSLGHQHQVLKDRLQTLDTSGRRAEAAGPAPERRHKRRKKKDKDKRRRRHP